MPTKDLRNLIAQSVEELKSEPASWCLFADNRVGANFDWRILQSAIARRLIERHAPALESVSEDDIHSAIYDWWIQNAPIPALREQATYLRMGVGFGDIDESWLEVALELEQVATIRANQERL